MTESMTLSNALWLHPSFVLIAGALLTPLLRGNAQKMVRVALALLVLYIVFSIDIGVYGTFSFAGMEIITGRADKLSLAFTYVFSIITLIATIYSLHVKDNIQHVTSIIYAASAIGVTLAGDLMTVYVFWEMMMLASVWLIWRRATPTAYTAGYRYLVIHAISGVLLLAGIVVYFGETGSIAFEHMQTESLSFYLILFGFMINAAVPPMGAWLPDAYPEATITGAIFLSALTTKTAVYTLIRGYPGTELLLWLGVIMTLWGVTYAMLANDLRRLLSYHIISQVGYMVTGVGLGTAMALNGATAHAFTHILYKAVLFMGAGAVITMTGRSKISDLGGLYRYMPLTFLLYMIGAFSISGVPLFSGFVSKTMVLEAAALERNATVWLLLMMAGVGTFLSVGLKLPYLTFIGNRENDLTPPKEAPWNMLLAMAIAGVLCIFIGVYPAWLYQYMPTEVNYNAFSLGHLYWELQLLLFTALGFFLVVHLLSSKGKTNLDTDWVYRRGGPVLVYKLAEFIRRTWRGFIAGSLGMAGSIIRSLRGDFGRGGVLGDTWSIGATTIWIALFLGLFGAFVVFF